MFWRCIFIIQAFLALFGNANAQNVVVGTAPPDPYACPTPQSLYNSTSGLAQKDATLTTKTFIAIIVGQSNAGNHLQGLYMPTQDVRMVNICGDRLVYQAAEPMLGTSITPNGYQGWKSGYGSLWAKTGDLLIASAKYDRVIFVNASYAGQPISAFMPSGQLGYALPLAFSTLNSLGIKPSQVDAILAMEGESDQVYGTSQAAYTVAMRQWIMVAKNLGFTGKWVVPLETYAYGCTSTDVRAAQAAIADGVSVIAGPDFDTLGTSNRYQEIASAGCASNAYVHFNMTGRDAAAALWKTTIYANF